LAEKHPEDKSTVERLESFLNRDDNRRLVFNLDRAVDVVHATSRVRLAALLAELVSSGLLEIIVRVESSNGGGIGDFPSIEAVPDEIYDRRTDRIIPVSAENIQVLYATPNEFT